MKNFKKIKIDYRISGTKLKIPFKAICSITNKSFKGNVEVEYCPKDFIIEYVSFEDYIKEVTKQKSTVEELTNRIFKKVIKVINPKYLKILIDVEMSKSHRPTKVWIET